MIHTDELPGYEAAGGQNKQIDQQFLRHYFSPDRIPISPKFTITSINPDFIIAAIHLLMMVLFWVSVLDPPFIIATTIFHHGSLNEKKLSHPVPPEPTNLQFQRDTSQS